MAKKEMEQSDIDRVLEENAALKAQNDQVLDGLIEMREEMALLKAGQAHIPPPVFDTEAQLDAELVALQEEFADYPAIEVLSQRVLVGRDANFELRLTDEASQSEDPGGTARRWKLRWFNTAKEGRAAQAQAEGYVKVEWRELRDADNVASADRKDIFVRQGHEGKDMLYKIPLKMFVYKKKRDAARQNGLLSSEGRLRDHLSNSVAGLAGGSGGNADRAGSFVKDKFSLTITKGEPERATF